MIWYSALLLALAAIATSAQQSVALTRLGSHLDGLGKILQLIGKRDGLTKFTARKLHLFIWQAPLSLLNTSVVMFIIGFAVLIWKGALPIWSVDNVKMKPHRN
jgi:Na+-transporting NADH:ubiquinone oxidoreductase subunit NqrB